MYEAKISKDRAGIFNTRISAYSFILTVIVIWIHAVEPASSAGTAAAAASELRSILENLLGTSLGQFAVPGSFCMSGYLFFRSLGSRDVSIKSDAAGGGSTTMPYDSMSWETNISAAKSYDIRSCVSHGSAAKSYESSVEGTAAYARESSGIEVILSKHQLARFFAEKLKSRIHTLLIPYLIWNGIYYLIYAAAGRRAWSIAEFPDALINYSCNPVFWYLHELIIITVLTPVIYLFIRKRAAAALSVIAVFAAAVCYDRLPVHIVNEDALFYYMMGAVLSLHFREYEEDDGIIRRAAAVCFLLLVICMDLSAAGTAVYVMAGTIGARISGLLAIYFAVSIFIKRPREKYEYERYNFFIYAVHYLEIRAVTGILDAVCMQLYGSTLYETEWLSAGSYVLMPFICIALSVFAGRLMKRYTPRLYAVLTGGRT